MLLVRLRLYVNKYLGLAQVPEVLKRSLCKKKLFFSALNFDCANLVASHLPQTCVPQFLLNGGIITLNFLRQDNLFYFLAAS